MAANSYHHLSEAIAALDAQLAIPNYDALAALFVERPESHYLSALKKYAPLASLYAGRDFPTDDDSFKLGGHNKELGHLHLEFEQKPDKSWVIRNLWMCR